ncbi:MAG TPA: hypothetical protein PKC49_12250 [Phycisphaerae bacterium]|nr:hypothetical protein [Phycisphaerae bacterium]
MYRHDGTYETIDYSSCCGRIVTDAGGVTTQYENDLLGRISTITHYQVASYGSYAAQPAMTTTYDYSEPLEETITVSAGSGQSQVTQTTLRTFDGAQRFTSVTTGSGGGALKTLYEYGTASGGGRKVTVYRDYASSATQGSSGVRDQISEYYRDGRIKSATGSTVVGSYSTTITVRKATASSGRWRPQVRRCPRRATRSRSTTCCGAPITSNARAGRAAARSR